MKITYFGGDYDSQKPKPVVSVKVQIENADRKEDEKEIVQKKEKKAGKTKRS